MRSRGRRGDRVYELEPSSDVSAGLSWPPASRLLRSSTSTTGVSAGPIRTRSPDSTWSSEIRRVSLCGRPAY